MALRFQIIPVFALKEDHNKLFLLSQFLNQDMAGLQKEHRFMMQLMNARIKWKELDFSKLVAYKCMHPKEFLVRM